MLDSIGELAQIYQLATAVFVGGSLVDHGGHNILEPAIFGKAIIFGPHMQNFKEIADTFLANGAAVQVQSDRELEEVLLGFLSDPVRRARLGAAARALVEANRGAKDKTLAVIAELVHHPQPISRSALPSGELILQTAGAIYGAVAEWRRRWYARSPARRRRLRRPVISVGNLSVGGSGKTPIVAHLARWLVAEGESPTILSRGYGRRRVEPGVTRRVGRKGDSRQPRLVR